MQPRHGWVITSCAAWQSCLELPRLRGNSETQDMTRAQKVTSRQLLVAKCHHAPPKPECTPADLVEPPLCQQH